MAKGLKTIEPGVGRSIKIMPDEIDESVFIQAGGKTFYVNGNAQIGDLYPGSDEATNDGLSWRYAFATIQKALDSCVSGRGDVIVVLGGAAYAEALSVTKDFVSIVGILPAGYGRPDVTPTTGKALTVAAQGFVAVNVRLVAVDTDAVLQRGNGFLFDDCVFDGDSGQAATDALLRLKGVTDDDSYTGSEGVVKDCLFRGSAGFGVAFDVGDGAGNQVGCTHNVFEDCLFDSNVAADIAAVDTSAGGAYSATDNRFIRCSIGLGTSKNKATHVDLDTTNGAANARNAFIDCFVNDDTIDTTAIATNANATNSWIGCRALDGLIDGDALD